LAQRSLVLLLGVLMLVASGCASIHRRTAAMYANRLGQSMVTEHFDVHWRAESRPAGMVNWVAKSAEQELARICAQLEVPNDRRYRILLFRDGDDLRSTVKAPGFVDSFSFGDALFLGSFDDATRIHEMVHTVAGAKIGDASTWFLGEGLANALLGSVHGWDVHGIARFYRQQKRLPPLVDMNGSPSVNAWMQTHGDLNTYDIAGSWVRFLIDTYGIAQTKRYYRGESPEAAFGVGLERLEAGWLAALDAYRPSPEMESQIALSGGASPTRLVFFEGESFGIEFGSEVHEKATAFRWRKDGVDIHGSSKPMLELHDAKPADTGAYVCEISYVPGPGAPVLHVSPPPFLLTIIPRAEFAVVKK
jgi:hypothetical protein